MFRKIVKRGLIGLIVFAVVVGFGLPRLLNTLGLHAHYEIPEYDLTGKRALIVTTSHDVLGDTGKPTGVAASEMTVPYYAFLDAGMEVDFASIKGGQIPIDPQTLRWPVVSPPDKRYLADQQAQSKAARSFEIGMVDIASYDIVFLAGGWGAAYDFAQSEALGEKMTESYADGAVIGGVCHGPLGLLQAKAPDGSPLVEGRKISAVTDKQVKELGISITPKHPERDLRAAGCEFEATSGFRDIFQTHVVVDGRIVTGQNQNSPAETAHRMMEVLAGANADNTDDDGSNESQEESVQLSSDPFLGRFQFSGGDQESEELQSIIETMSKDIPLPMRGMFKKRIGNATKIGDWFTFSSEGEILTLAESNGSTWPGNCDGEVHEGVTFEEKKATFTRKLSLDDDGSLVLTEKRSSDGAERMHRYTLAKNEASLRLEVSLKGKRLPRPVEYSLSYTRQN